MRDQNEPLMVALLASSLRFPSRCPFSLARKKKKQTEEERQKKRRRRKKRGKEAKRSTDVSSLVQGRTVRLVPCWSHSFSLHLLHRQHGNAAFGPARP